MLQLFRDWPAEMAYHSMEAKPQAFSGIQCSVETDGAQLRIGAARQAEHFQHRPHHAVHQPIADAGAR
jgi:hypothetical protein